MNTIGSNYFTSVNNSVIRLLSHLCFYIIYNICIRLERKHFMPITFKKHTCNERTNNYKPINYYNKPLRTYFNREL